jgi:WD40-like Beta Propeller Repeat
MNRNPTTFPLRLLVATAAMLLTLAACTQSVSDREQITNIQTIIAGTPSPTATLTPTITPTITQTPTSTVGPSPTPTLTPVPTITPPPPTPTPNPALTGFSLCEQQAGSGDGRFSARLSEARVSGSPAYEELTLTFEQPEGSAPLHATASCVSDRDFLERTSASSAPGAFVLEIGLADWLRDEAFSASAITQTLSFTTTRIVTSASFRIDPERETGATITIGLSEALPYRLRVERNPLRLTIAVAKSSSLVSSSDLLSLPAGGERLESLPPLLFLLDGDIWRVGQPNRSVVPGITPANASATNLTNSVETETAFTTSPDGALVAFCRAAPGLDPAESSFAVPSALWVIDSDGQNARKLAEVGVNCADPAFSLDGSQLAFSVDETGATPTQRSIWAVPSAGGAPERLAGGDEWSRSTPQWLADDSLAYAAAAEDGRRTLFLREAAGTEQDIGADLLISSDGAARYSALIEPLAARDGQTLAVTAPRADGFGAELLLLRTDGSLIETLGSGGGSQRDYWSRPLGWTASGDLLYLATTCRSTLVQDYVLYRWNGAGSSAVMLAGTSLGAFGAATTVGDGLAYVAASRGATGPRGPGAISLRSPSALWYWDIIGGPRGKLLEAERGVAQLR